MSKVVFLNFQFPGKLQLCAHCTLMEAMDAAAGQSFGTGLSVLDTCNWCYISSTAATARGAGSYFVVAIETDHCQYANGV